MINKFQFSIIPENIFVFLTKQKLKKKILMFKIFAHFYSHRQFGFTYVGSHQRLHRHACNCMHVIQRKECLGSARFLRDIFSLFLPSTQWEISGNGNLLYPATRWSNDRPFVKFSLNKFCATIKIFCYFFKSECSMCSIFLCFKALIFNYFRVKKYFTKPPSDLLKFSLPIIFLRINSLKINSSSQVGIEQTATTRLITLPVNQPALLD